ncbi:MAG: hypothetical protein Q9225_003683 [Loekoesia sp. 1 TL-2023]
MKTLIRLPHIPSTWTVRTSNSSRYLHQSSRASNSSLPGAITLRNTTAQSPTSRNATTPAPSGPPALSLLDFPTLLRSYLISAVSSSPLLLAPSLRFLSLLAHSTSPFLQHNRVLQYILKKTLYKHFCAGETPFEAQQTVAELKRRGFRGAILAYAKEIVFDEQPGIENSPVEEAKDVEAWKKGVLETIRLTESEDYAALKFSGAGHSIIQQLLRISTPGPVISEAVNEICEYAKSKSVRLLFDAEQHAVQDGIDQWTLDLQRKYNRGNAALVYGTYQAYLRSTPVTLAQHLTSARREGYTLGVKLVRGAYLASDPRHLFWEAKTKTDRAYNGIAESLMHRQWNDVLSPAESDSGQQPAFPNVDLVLATHNHESVRKATVIRREQIRTGKEHIRLAYAQLMGMADEVSCELILAGQRSHGVWEEKTEKPQAYKYLVWGTVEECLKYLLRRAEENRDALARAKEGRTTLGKELRRRLLRL